jgi:hypothetical protein
MVPRTSRFFPSSSPSLPQSETGDHFPDDRLRLPLQQRCSSIIISVIIHLIYFVGYTQNVLILWDQASRLLGILFSPFWSMTEGESCNVHCNEHQKNRAATFVIRLQTEMAENKTLSPNPS